MLYSFFYHTPETLETHFLFYFFFFLYFHCVAHNVDYFHEKFTTKRYPKNFAARGSVFFFFSLIRFTVIKRLKEVKGILFTFFFSATNQKLHSILFSSLSLSFFV
jgi:hypothetical protein